MSIIDQPYQESYPPSLWGGGGGAGDPAISSLAPSTLPASAGATAITVTGARFVSGSVVEVNQAPVTTTYVSATQLTATFDPTVAGTVTFTVRNPNDEESNGQPFVVTAGAEEEPEPEVRELPGDVAYFTVAQVQAWVDAHEHLAADVLVHEEARGSEARVTLVTWLQGFIESHDGEDPEG
jgi:hypothetical protein